MNMAVENRGAETGRTEIGIAIKSQVKWWLVVGLLSGCIAEEEQALQCNGYAELCSRRLNEVAMVRTHNAHASEDRDYHSFAMNHFRAVPQQLADGVRALNIDVYDFEGEYLVCHGSCELGSQPLAEILSEIRTFVSKNPHEVVLLDLQNEMPAEQTAAALEQSGLTEYFHVQNPAEPWPTLQELIESGKRMVFLADRGENLPDWYMATRDHVFGTPWGAGSKEELSCDLAHEVLEHGLFELDHTLTYPTALPWLAETVNFNPYFLERARECQERVGRFPNLISLDYYSTSDVFAVVDALNGVGEFKGLDL